MAKSRITRIRRLSAAQARVSDEQTRAAYTYRRHSAIGLLAVIEERLKTASAVDSTADMSDVEWITEIDRALGRIAHKLT